MDKLKPCPFCGNKHITIRKGKYSWIIECCNTDCNAAVVKYLKKEAIEAWNRRVENADLYLPG